MIKILNSIAELWTIHPQFRMLTYVMSGSWLIMIFITGGSGGNSSSSNNNQPPTVTNSRYKSGAPTPPLPAGASLNNSTRITKTLAPVQVKPGLSTDSATFEEAQNKDDFAIIKESK